MHIANHCCDFKITDKDVKKRQFKNVFSFLFYSVVTVFSEYDFHGVCHLSGNIIVYILIVFKMPLKVLLFIKYVVLSSSKCVYIFSYYLFKARI